MSEYLRKSELTLEQREERRAKKKARNIMRSMMTEEEKEQNRKRPPDENAPNGYNCYGEPLPAEWNAVTGKSLYVQVDEKIERGEIPSSLREKRIAEIKQKMGASHKEKNLARVAAQCVLVMTDDELTNMYSDASTPMLLKSLIKQAKKSIEKEDTFAVNTLLKIAGWFDSVNKVVEADEVVKRTVSYKIEDCGKTAPQSIVSDSETVEKLMVEQTIKTHYNLGDNDNEEY